MGELGTKLEGHFIIIGWDDFAKKVAGQILSTNQKLAIITDNKNHIDLIHDFFNRNDVFTLFTDLENFEGLEKANISKADKIFINLTNDTSTLVYLINLKKHYPKAEIVVLLASNELKETYQSLGIKYLISKNEITSKLVASYLFEQDVATLTEELLNNSTTEKDYDIAQYLVTKENPYNGQNYLEAFVEMKKKNDVVLIGLAKHDGPLLKNPGNEAIIEANDHLIMIANGEKKNIIEKVFNITEGRIR